MTTRQNKKRPGPDLKWESQLDAIWHIVSEYMGVQPQDADSKSRRSHLVRARHIYYYLAKRHTLHTWRSIAYYTGGRDHSTAISVLRSYDEMRWLVPVSRFCAKLRDCFQVVRGKVLEVVAAHRPMDVEWGALFRAVVSGNGYAVPYVFTPKGAQAVFRYFVAIHQYRTL